MVCVRSSLPLSPDARVGGGGGQKRGLVGESLGGEVPGYLVVLSQNTSGLIVCSNTPFRIFMVVFERYLTVHVSAAVLKRPESG